jgi:23S rRNA (cytosine1962-C5)-methyltransferase
MNLNSTLRHHYPNLVLFEDEGFVVINKPSGYTTHRSNEKLLGIQELVSQLAGQPLTAAHRLDRDTSGILVLCKTEESLSDWHQRFEKREVTKTYAFLSATHFAPSHNDLTMRTRIEPDAQKKGLWTSQLTKNDSAANAITKHLECKAVGDLFLHTVQPETGRTHQIRLHARDWNCPISGDLLYGAPCGGKKTEFPRLALHAQRLEWRTERQKFLVEAPLPESFGIHSRAKLPLEWLIAIERRQLLSPATSNTTVRRWLHKTDFSADSILKCTIDQAGPVVVVSDFAEVGLNVEPQALQALAEKLEVSHWIYRRMFERGADPSAREWLCSQNAPLRWTAAENGLTFEFRRDSGASVGLFFDQRENRKRIAELSLDKRVLNLFAYTGGFSVAAAKAGAKEVVTVDTSRNTLEWAKHNFSLNELDPQKQNLEFFATESEIFLKGAEKRGRLFDLIICDPPSLARNKSGVFRIQQDLSGLVQSCLRVLAPSGILLFSTNYEPWTPEELEARVLAAANGALEKAEPGRYDFDHELPHQPRVLKSAFFKRNLG